MESQNTSFDVVIVGGGAAGIMAALSAKFHHPDYSVAVVDRSKELGRKLLTAGAGRGNLTNSNLAHGPGRYFHGDEHMISSIFSQFGYVDIMKFLMIWVFRSMKKENKKGKYSVIDHAKTVRDMLVDALVEKGISIL